MSYGARITDLYLPDRTGNVEDVLLGFSELSEYVLKQNYFGCTIGRYANRIRGGAFYSQGKLIQLSQNEGPNHLHGGYVGYGDRWWNSFPIDREGRIGVRMELIDPAGTEGYPGEVFVRVEFTLGKSDLLISYYATTDERTPLSLTNHMFLRLSGLDGPCILDHELQVNANQVVFVDKDKLPVGAPRAVSGTPFDLRQARKLGGLINSGHPQIAITKGVDHCWIFDEYDEMQAIAHLYDPNSGRQVTVLTTEPGVQVFTANTFNCLIVGKSGEKYRAHSGVCLETQRLPDSPNHPEFADAFISPEEGFYSQTQFVFRTD
jgi:aldose 1-epimerase